MMPIIVRVFAEPARGDARVNQMLNKLESVNHNKVILDEGLVHITIDPVVMETPNLPANGNSGHPTNNSKVRRSTTCMEPPSNSRHHCVSESVDGARQRRIQSNSIGRRLSR